MRILKDPILWIAVLVAFFAVTGNAIVSPLIPFLGDPLGILPEQTGNIIWVFTISVMFATPIIGWLSDRYGRKPVLIPSIFLFGVGALIPLVDSYGLILFIRALQGISVAGMTSLAVTILGDCYEGRELKSAVGFRSGAHSLAFAISPAIAGVLAVFGIFFPFFFYALAIPIGFFALWKMKECHVGTRHTLRGYIRDIWKILSRRNSLSVLFAVSHVFFLLYVMVVFAPSFLEERFDLTALGIGLMQTLFFAIAAISSLLAGRMVDHFGEQRLIVGGFVFSGILVALVPLAQSLAFMALLLALWGATYGSMFASIYKLAVSLAPKAYRAGAVSVAQMSAYFGASLSAVALTFVWTYYGLSIVFVTGGLLGVATLGAALAGWFRVEEQGT